MAAFPVYAGMILYDFPVTSYEKISFIIPEQFTEKAGSL